MEEIINFLQEAKRSWRPSPWANQKEQLRLTWYLNQNLDLLFYTKYNSNKIQIYLKNNITQQYMDLDFAHFDLNNI